MRRFWSSVAAYARRIRTFLVVAFLFIVQQIFGDQILTFVKWAAKKAGMTPTAALLFVVTDPLVAFFGAIGVTLVGIFLLAWRDVRRASSPHDEMPTESRVIAQPPERSQPPPQPHKQSAQERIDAANERMLERSAAIIELASPPPRPSKEPDLLASHVHLLTSEVARVAELVQPRSVRDRNAGARMLAAGLGRLRESLRAASWSPEDVSKPFTIFIISLAADGETLRYRQDLEAMFKAGGFEVTCVTWPPSSWVEEFTGMVTVLNERPDNVVRPLVIEALRVAGVEIREAWCPAWPRGANTDGFEKAAARLVSGRGDRAPPCSLLDIGQSPVSQRSKSSSIRDGNRHPGPFHPSGCNMSPIGASTLK